MSPPKKGLDDDLVIANYVQPQPSSKRVATGTKVGKSRGTREQLKGTHDSAAKKLISPSQKSLKSIETPKTQGSKSNLKYFTVADI
jgi:hypothetical protein